MNMDGIHTSDKLMPFQMRCFVQIRDIGNVISDFGQVSSRGELSDEARVSLAFDVRGIEFNVTTTTIAGGSLTR